MNDKPTDMTIEDTPEEKILIHQRYSCFSVISSIYGKLKAFQEAWHNDHPEEWKGWLTSIGK